MAGCSTFWLMVHELATALENEDAPPEVRVAELADDFEALPPIAQEELRRSFDVVYGDLHALTRLLDRRLSDSA